MEIVLFVIIGILCLAIGYTIGSSEDNKGKKTIRKSKSELQFMFQTYVAEYSAVKKHKESSINFKTDFARRHGYSGYDGILFNDKIIDLLVLLIILDEFATIHYNENFDEPLISSPLSELMMKE